MVASTCWWVVCGSSSGIMDETQRRVIEFGLDSGFGERNSLGFGFVNKISLRKSHLYRNG